MLLSDLKIQIQDVLENVAILKQKQLKFWDNGTQQKIIIIL